jgi:hypothetical protein
MSKYLVVANQTTTSPRLVQELRDVARHEPGAEFVLVVPATAVRDLFFRRSPLEKAEAVARKHADKGRAHLVRAGLVVADARVVGGEPVSAVEQELRDADYAGVVISTLHGEHSAWLRMGLPQKVAAIFGGEVRHVETPPEWAGP